MFLRLVAAVSVAGWLSASLASGETRPRYGGVLRVEVRMAGDTADPPQSGPGLADLIGNFNITEWEGGRRAVFEANEAAAGGRPYVDRVEVQLARALRDQSADLETGKADIVELGPNELRRSAAGRKVWSSAPVRVVALVFGARVEDARVREALSLAVDRGIIHRVLLQQQGEVSGALLPQWLSGYAFLFPATADMGRARSLLAGLPATARTLTLGVDDAALRPIADRIALTARDAGLMVTVVTGASDVRLTEFRITSTDPARALAAIAGALGMPLPAHAASAEGLYAAERALLEGFRVAPLFHLPDSYGAGGKVKGGPGISPLGEWRFENLWVEGERQ
ncbi:MAG TPA: ABC transporter substrate-binding protein [Verrucomicrobiae bacterium]|nr:ABC transporter substrate-binding protein [Verrucomicrobiae bacterium]